MVERYRKGLQGGLGNLASRVLRGKRWSVPRAVERFGRGELGVPPPPPPSMMDGSGTADDGDAASSASAETEIESEPLTSTTADAEPAASTTTSSSTNTWTPAETALWALLHTTTTRCTTRYLASDASSACKKILSQIYATNAFLQAAAPWTSPHLTHTPVASTPFDNSVSDLVSVDRTIYLCAESLRLVGIMLLPVMPEKMGRLLDMLGVGEGRRTWEWVQPGRDVEFGRAKEGVGMGKGVEGVLFPPLEDP